MSENTNAFDNIINYYYSLLRDPQEERGGSTGINRGSRHKADIENIGRGLYGLLIKPVEAQIRDKENLIMVPDGILAFVPFEAIMDDSGKYLAEIHHISYLQSLDIRKLIRERKYGEKRRPLLAFGGAVYEERASGVNAVENETQLAFLIKKTYSDLENIQIELSKKSIFYDPDDIPSVRNAYGALGMGSWRNLPGTLSEVNNIKHVISKSNIFTGKNVTEKDIKEFSGNWTLYNHKILHFATHCLVVCDIPELSAVVLSQFEKDEGKEDGYLRMGEISGLQIQADLVNLTACGAGSGMIHGGEGIMGLTQSFILAGANAVSISLWQVADESTSQFMLSMYEMVRDKGISYRDAMTEVKRKFINGSFGEKYKSQYYWAPFVYYGN